VARRAEAEGVKLRKLAAGFGAEADAIPPDFREVWDAFFASQVLVFRNQRFTPAGFLSFARQFGKPEPHVIDQFHHPEQADILILSNVQKDGQPTGLADAGTYFHTDYSYLDVPARCTTLYSIQVPKKGGDTVFANQYAAYDGLSSNLKKKIENLVALHHYGNRDDQDRASRTVASVLTGEQEEKMTWVRHKVARKHPITGRTALYSVSGSSFRIEGMPDDEAVELLDELKRHSTQEKYQLRLQYGVGDVVVWDNASLLHSATLTDPADPRTLWRITIKEERRT
jgi:taurine dioxygenase